MIFFPGIINQKYYFVISFFSQVYQQDNVVISELLTKGSTVGQPRWTPLENNSLNSNLDLINISEEGGESNVCISVDSIVATATLQEVVHKI